MGIPKRLFLTLLNPGSSTTEGLYANKECWVDMSGHVFNFLLHDLRESLRRSNVNDVIYDADGACEGRYGCRRGPYVTNMANKPASCYAL